MHADTHAQVSEHTTQHTRRITGVSKGHSRTHFDAEASDGPLELKARASERPVRAGRAIPTLWHKWQCVCEARLHRHWHPSAWHPCRHSFLRSHPHPRPQPLLLLSPYPPFSPSAFLPFLFLYPFPSFPLSTSPTLGSFPTRGGSGNNWKRACPSASVCAWRPEIEGRRLNETERRGAGHPSFIHLRVLGALLVHPFEYPFVSGRSPPTCR